MSVRVIRARAAGEAPLPPARAEVNVRTIDAERWNARIQGEQIIASARASAEAMVRAAHSQAAAIADGAEKEGLSRAAAAAAATLIVARAEAEKIATRATDIVTNATRAVAERALGRALALDDALLSAWASEALTTLAGARKISVHGHRATLARLDLPVAKHEADMPEGALLVRSDLGDVKLELSTQIDALVSAIGELLAAEVRRRA